MGPNSRIFLGDFHNFGRRVHVVRSGNLFKPRTVRWEQLLLSRSDFKEFLNGIFLKNFEWSPFNLFPTLTFSEVTDHCIGSGQVEILEELQGPHTLTEMETVQIGSVIGLCSWLGLSDLHEDNFSFGRKQTGHLICAPLDIECIFNDFALPSQTHIVTVKNTINSAGLTKLNTNIEAKVSKNFLACLTHGYLASLHFLESNRTVIAVKFSEIENHVDWPVRVIVKDTKEYHSSSVLGLIPHELEQLHRGDIPYFFRTGRNSETTYLDCTPLVGGFSGKLHDRINAVFC